MSAFDNILELFISYIIMRGIIVPFIVMLFRKYLLDPSVRWFKQRYLKTERDIAIWLHYRNKAMNKGHNHELVNCDDGQCRKI